MTTEAKIDYPPLLDGGIHPYTLEELRQLAVESFPGAARRAALFDALKIYLDLLTNTGLQATVWIDGSFMCLKPDPDDIDMVIVFDPQSARQLSEAARPVVYNLLDTHYAFARFRLHVFRVSSDDHEGLQFWQQKFGTQRDERTPKGLAALRVNT